MKNFIEIPYIKLTVSQKSAALEILARGNSLLKKWAAFCPQKKFRQFRNEIMKGNKNPNSVIPPEKMAEFKKELPLMTAIRNEMVEALGNRSVEQALLESFSAMAKKHARKWALEGDPVGLTLYDFLQEAYATVIEAIYGWSADGANISTFVWTALKNRMSSVTNQQGNLLCPLTNTDLELMGRYETTKRKMEQRRDVSRVVTFDQVIEELGLSQGEGRQLTLLMTRVFAENQLGGLMGGDQVSAHFDSQFDNCLGNDYTGQRAGIEQDLDNDRYVQEQSVAETLTLANLTPLERTLLEAAMSPTYGWQSDFAKSHVNPTTKVPYTRARITQVLMDARRKVATVLERKAQKEPMVA